MQLRHLNEKLTKFGLEGGLLFSSPYSMLEMIFFVYIPTPCHSVLS